MDTSTAPTLAVEMVEDSDEETTDSSSQDEGKAGDEEIEASLIADCGLNSSTCGYCKSKQDTSVSYGETRCQTLPGTSFNLIPSPLASPAGMIANRLTPQEYQGWSDHGRSKVLPTKTLLLVSFADLIDLGWRRSGRYIYKVSLL
jgi:hypothetical protein